jgi:hypothetical protein
MVQDPSAKRLRAMKRTWTALVAAVSLAGALRCGEDRHAAYRSFHNLETADAGARSWFPRCTPRSAVNLEEVHNLDTNIVVGRFHVMPRELSLLTSCGPPTREIDVELHPEVSGWPECLTGRITSARLQGCGMSSYSDSRFTVIVAMSGDVFFWSNQ